MTWIWSNNVTWTQNEVEVTFNTIFIHVNCFSKSTICGEKVRQSSGHHNVSILKSGTHVL